MYSFWISPRGEIVGTTENHINTIIAQPEKFGLSMDRIKKFYDYYNEPIGVEANAREKIIGMVLQQGWIRVRQYRNRWSMTVDRLTPSVRKNISVFMDKALSGGIQNVRRLDKYAEMTIVELSGGVHKYTLEELGNYVLVETHKLDESVWLDDGSVSQVISASDLANAVPIPIYFEEVMIDTMMKIGS
tara:strand:+ start:794 stop:1357 length:564 start_codon:yes stop_codon:yes gene_type:complete